MNAWHLKQYKRRPRTKTTAVGGSWMPGDGMGIGPGHPDYPYPLHGQKHDHQLTQGDASFSAGSIMCAHTSVSVSFAASKPFSFRRRGCIVVFPHTHTHTHVRVCVDGGALCVFTGECNLNCIKIDWIHGAQLPGPLFPPLTACQQTGHPVNGSRDCPLPRHHSFSSLLLRPSSGWCLFCAPLSGQLALKIVYTQTSQHFTLRTHDPNLRGLMTCLTLTKITNFMS